MALSPGTWLNHYEVLGHLGTGGMGEVYRARDNKLQREVALKVLPKAFAQDPERLARFRREAQVLAQLNHPNIAAVHSVEESEGTHFLVMELALGETLRDRSRAGPFGIASPYGRYRRSDSFAHIDRPGKAFPAGRKRLAAERSRRIGVGGLNPRWCRTERGRPLPLARAGMAA